MSSSSRTSSERWRDRSTAACMTASCRGAVSWPCGDPLLWSAWSPACSRAPWPAPAHPSIVSDGLAICCALVEIEDLRRADVRLGLVARDLSDLAHDLGHALGLAQDDVDGAIVHVVGRHLLLEQLRVAHHRRERLVELVRGGAGELGDERLLLRDHQLLLRLHEPL